ncbi:MAG: transaldolase family protein [Ruminiclostridium sp.]
MLSSPNMVVKIPATNEGVKAIAKLEKGGIATCATAILTSAKALICAVARTHYIRLYIGQEI